MNKQFENMQKLAFGKTLIKESTINKKFTRDALKAHIREVILDEAKKKKDKPEDVAPQEDVDLNMGDEQLSAGEEAPPSDTVAPEANMGGDIDPTVKSIQDLLQKAYALAQQLGDAKLATQIGNTLTMLLRDQVLGQQ
jgi:hypothetical protein